MISKQQAYDFMASHKSRYEYMIESLMIEDRANAEVCRLGSFAWQEICSLIGNTDVTDFDSAVESVIKRMTDRWEKYLETGIPQNSVQEMVDETVRNHQSKIKSIYEDPFRFVPESAQQEKIPASALLPAENPVESAQKSGKRKKDSKPALIEQAPVVNSELLSHVNRTGIQSVVDEIRQEVLNVEDDWMQELNRRAEQSPDIVTINE